MIYTELSETEEPEEAEYDDGRGLEGYFGSLIQDFAYQPEDFRTQVEWLAKHEKIDQRVQNVSAEKIA